MLDKATAAKILLCAVLLVPASQGYAKNARKIHPEPWPIWDWRNHQPTQRQLDALREKDPASGEERQIDRLYLRFEQTKFNILAPERKNQ
jgi:hypothetical protein